MGNCQASDAAATLLEYPNGRTERFYWTISARQVMLQNPGYYIGIHIWPKPPASPKKKPKLKILPPSAILVPGYSYRLVSFEEVMNKIASKRTSQAAEVAFLTGPRLRSRIGSEGSEAFYSVRDKDEDKELEEIAMSQQEHSSRNMSFARQWRPSLQSISETVVDSYI